MKTSPEVRRYLGWTLVPQAGVAIGLATVAETLVPAYAAQIKVVVLSATLVYELVGPVLTKYVLTKAGEIDPSVEETQPQEQMT